MTDSSCSVAIQDPASFNLPFNLVSVDSQRGGESGYYLFVLRLTVKIMVNIHIQQCAECNAQGVSANRLDRKMYAALMMEKTLRHNP